MKSNHFDEASSAEVSSAEDDRADSPIDFDNDVSDSRSLAEKIESRIKSGEKFFSLEFFPPRTKEGAVNLLARYFFCSGVNFYHFY